ncbi:hypothetical protein [Streptomyces halstedii]|uniref:hypothetical protein n=1 Tax=Streptomyces halstedii TaxID=1944 RepID=UPI0036BBA6CD
MLGQSGKFGVATRRFRCFGTDGCSGPGSAAPPDAPRAGDTVRAETEGLGVMENHVVAAP